MPAGLEKIALVAAAGALAASCGGSATGPTPVPSPTPAPRPNIVLVLMDDLDQANMAHMPRMQALLASRGTTFDNFFVTFPLCCPSRATILRGQYVHNHSIWGNALPGGGWELFNRLGHEESTIGTWLADAGYRTVLLGKYLNQYPEGNATYVPPGWTEWYGLLEDRPAAYFEYYINENGSVHYYGLEPQNYEADVLGAHTVSFIERAEQNDSQPFFIHMNPAAPHAPAIPAPRHAGLFQGRRAPRVPSFNEEDVFDKPSFIRDQPPLTDREIERLDELYANRLETLLGADEMIERVVQALERHGEMENTYIFLTSDNGVHHGQHRFPGGKNAGYEEAVRVGLVVRGPGVPAGQRRDHLAGNVDLAPTFAALARATAPPFVDGKSMVPLLGAGAPDLNAWREVFLLEKGDTGAPFRVPPFFGVRSQTHKLLDYFNTRGREYEFYDLRSDPYEMDSMRREQASEVFDRLFAHIQRLKVCAGDTCR